MPDMTSWHLSHVQPTTDLIIVTIFTVVTLTLVIGSDYDHERENVHRETPELEALDLNDTEISTEANSPTYNKYSQLYEHIDRARLKKSCSKAKDCRPSGEILIVCGSDGQNYQNIGVLACAQLCNLELKFKGFDPCPNSVPLPPPTFPTASAAATTAHLHSRVLEELVDNTDIKAEDVLKYLERRIKTRNHVHGLPPILEYWCKDNPGECPYGYDPLINKGVYIIPAIPYSEMEYRKKKTNNERI